MAITSLINPSGNPSLHDSMWHIATSSNVNNSNFKFVFDLHDPNGVQYSRTKIFPDPNTAKGYFDSAAIMRNTISIDWFEPSNNFVTAIPNTSGQIGKEYQIRVGEEYTSGGVILTDINMTNANCSGFNYFPRLFNNLPGENLKIRPDDFQSNRPRYNSKVPYGTRVIMMPFYAPNGITGEVEIFQPNSKKNLSWPNPDISFTVAASGSRFYQLNMSPTGLFAFNTQDFDFPKDGRFIVKLNNKPFELIWDCQPQHTPILLHFVNAYGMFETVSFNLVNKLNMKVGRKAYNQDGLTYGNTLVDKYRTSNVHAGIVYNETKINYVQNVDWTYKLMMEAPTDAEYVWLAELIFSPLIYMQLGENFYPVTITNSTYEYSKQVYNKLRNLEIEVELNQSRRGISR